MILKREVYHESAIDPQLANQHPGCDSVDRIDCAAVHENHCIQ